MQLSKHDLTTIKNRFRSNQRALADVRKKIEIIETENRQLMNLISETKESVSLEDIAIDRIIAKRMSKIKFIKS